MNTMRSRTLLILSMSLVLLLSACDRDTSEPVLVNESSISVVNRPDTGTLTADYARFRKSQISNPAYHLQVDLQQDSQDFTGVVNISFDLSANNVSPVTLDFDSGVIQNLTVNDATIEANYERWFLSIPATALVAGANKVSITYSRPFANDGAGLHKFTDPENGEEYFYTNFEPYNANRLFPHFDQPNLKAPLTLEVRAPVSWQVIANTREAEIRSEGDRNHWLFPATAPLSS